MAKSKFSLGKCHTALENMWVIFKYLLTLISNIIPQWNLYDFRGFPGATSGKEATCQCRRHKRYGLTPGLGRRPTPVVLPRKFHGQRSLASYRPWGCRVRHTWAHFMISTHDHEILRLVLCSLVTFCSSHWYSFLWSHSSPPWFGKILSVLTALLT